MAELKRRLEEFKADHASKVASLEADHASKVETLERLLQNVAPERQPDNNTQESYSLNVLSPRQTPKTLHWSGSSLREPLLSGSVEGAGLCRSGGKGV